LKRIAKRSTWKMMKRDPEYVGSISVGTVLFLIFLVLKLTGLVQWSWWWVTAPLWIEFVLIVLLFVSMIIFFAIKEILK
jgi:CBS domain containing-hemolysin-like protein